MYSLYKAFTPLQRGEAGAFVKINHKAYDKNSNITLSLTSI